MRITELRTWIVCLLTVAVALVAAGPAYALILGGNGSPPPSPPADALIGQWMDNASCVAVGPDMVITTRHQGSTDPGATYITIGGTTYTVAEFFNHGSADLRLARIVTAGGQPASLGQFAAVATGTDEVGRSMYLGGYGVGRAIPLPAGAGWSWGADDTKALRWGANSVTEALAGQAFGPYKSDLIRLRFDAGGPVGEAISADGDSGGGWFRADTLQLIGLTAYLSDGARQAAYGDTASAIRLSTYASWVSGVLAPIRWQGGTAAAWSAAGAWSGGAAPNARDTWAVFGADVTSPLALALDRDATVGTLRFDAPANVAISGPGHTLTFDAGPGGTTGIEINRLAAPGYAASHTISSGLFLAAPLVVNQNSLGDLTLAGPIAGAAGCGITKNGPGTAVLAAANSFAGGVVVNAGTLRVTDPAGMGAGPVTLAGGTLDLRADSSAAFANTVTVMGSVGMHVDSTGGTGHELSIAGLTVAGDRTITFTGGGSRLAVAGGTSITNLATGPTFNLAGADVTLAGGLTLLSGSLTKLGPGKLVIGGPMLFGAGSTVSAAEGTVRLNSDAGGLAQVPRMTLIASGSAAVELASTQHLAALNMKNSATATLACGQGGTLVTKALAFDGGPAAPTATLDMTTSLMAIDYGTGASPINDVRRLVLAGRSGGSWTGPGITSSDLAAAAARGDKTCGIGYADNASLPVPLTALGNVSPVAVTKTSVLVRYTYAGDLNLDGKVDDDDVAIMALGYDRGAASSRTWTSGDVWGYDGRVNDDDVSIMAVNYGKGVIGGSASAAAGLGASGAGQAATYLPDQPSDILAGGGAAAPEPLTIALVLLGGAGLVVRRALGAKTAR